MIQRKEIESVFAEMLDLIKDATLRKKVLDAWMLGVERGGWKSMAELREMPFTLAAESRGISFIEHVLVVTKGALGLATGSRTRALADVPAEDAATYAMVSRADTVGVFQIESAEVRCTHSGGSAGTLARHPLSGAMLAAEAGLSQEVVNIIACHAREGEGAPQVVETVFIHQADFAAFDPLVMKTKGLLIE